MRTSPAKIAALSLFFILIFSVFTSEIYAKTNIYVLHDSCIIEVLAHKEFHISSRTAVQGLLEHTQKKIEEIQKKIEKLQKELDALMDKLSNPGRLRRAWNWYKRESGFDAEADIRRDISKKADELTAANKRLNWQRDRLNGLQEVLRAEVAMRAGLTDAAVEQRIRDWVGFMGRFWNKHNYVYDCCRVRIYFKFKIRQENDPPTPGYDQITIHLSSDWRSFVSGFYKDFDADNFSPDPYEHDMTGEWAYDDPRQEFLVCHESGHELGLGDLYKDVRRPDGTIGADVEPANRNNIMNDPLNYGNTVASINVINQIETMLRKRKIRCPPGCCEGRGLPRRLRFSRPHVAYDASRHPEDGTLAAPPATDVSRRPEPDEAAKDAAKTADAVKESGDTAKKTGDAQGEPTGDASSSPTGDTTSRPEDSSGAGDANPPIQPTPTPPTVKDTNPPPPDGPAQVTDASSGGMIIEEPRPLEDASSGFDKAPSPDLIKYEKTTASPGDEEIQYKQLKTDSVTCDTAALYKTTPQGMDVTTSSVATGKGADFRKWKIEDVRMSIDGKVKKPDKEENFYIEKESYYKGAAVATFVALGSQYRQDAEKAGSGEVCHASGGGKERGPVAESIDRAGMAAGMGLLASQARGSIPAKKATFKLNQKEAQDVRDKKAQLRVTAANESAHHQQETFNLPLH